MKITNKEQLHEVVTELVEDSFNEIFIKIHTLAKTTSGDIDPGAVVNLDEMQKKLVGALKIRFIGLTTQTVWWNMPKGQKDYRKAMKELNNALKKLK